MTAIHLSDVSFGHDEARPLFRGIDLRLEPGWHGVVGANGAGKSTLLSLLAGSVTPQRGRVLSTPGPLRTAWVPQDTAVRAPQLEALAERHDGLAARWRGRLAVNVEDLARWETLSPGERMRWHLCGALLDEPDVLLLDEPTSHVDADAQQRVLEALRRYPGIGVLVSHDRGWLDALCEQTIWLEDGRARTWSGGYGAASAGRALEREAALAARALARAEVTRQARATEAAQRERASAEAMISAKRRMRSVNDRDARGMGEKTRAQWAEARLGRSAGVRREQLARAEQRLAELSPVRDPRGRAIAFEPVLGGGPIVLCLDGRDVCAGERVLLRDVRVTLRRGERVWLRGDNGAGKTTLLRALIAERGPERALYVPQEIDAASTRAHQRTLAALTPDARGRAYQRLAALGCDPSAVASSPSPSAGEARKLAIAAGLARPLDAILLDEPTNHLDLPSIERLERALSEFEGALLIVSHDVRFAEALCERRWMVRGGVVR